MTDQADRHNQGKPELSYLGYFKEALEAFSRVCTYGSAKYARFNWLKGAPLSQSVDSLQRHLLAWQSGQDVDPESGQHHLAHMLWNAMRLTQEALTRPELDDRPGKGQLAPRGPQPGETWKCVSVGALVRVVKNDGVNVVYAPKGSAYTCAICVFLDSYERVA